jgi:hypothetical protein
MKIGFTGTQYDMSAAQEFALQALLELRYSCNEFHHGDCIGSDAKAHVIAKALRYRPIIHPPIDPKKRAWCEAPACDIREPKPYLERNKDIVDETELLLATPAEATEQLRSGTWATIRYARALKRKIIIIRPDGSMP